MDSFDTFWDQARPAFSQERTWGRARTLALSALVGMGRRTVTGMLSASAQTGADWSAAYRLFERERFDKDALFAPARRGVCSRLGETDPLVVLMDDTLVRKRGRQVFGAAWKRDPLGPPFCNNFVWGQRFLQLSAALPEGLGPHRARGIPIDLTHSPLPKKPWRTAPPSAWDEYHRLQKTMKVSAVGVERIKALRALWEIELNFRDEKTVLGVGGGPGPHQDRRGNRALLHRGGIRLSADGICRRWARTDRVAGAEVAQDGAGRTRLHAPADRGA
jgi:hypothetical protein